MTTPESFVVEVDRVAVGGAGIAKAPDGRVTFVAGGVPGDRLVVAPTKAKKSLIEARITEIERPSSLRVTPPCRHLEDGCGGCDWQQVAESAQPMLRTEIVADALRRIGRLNDVEIRSGPPLSATGYRTLVRAAVANGRAGFRKSSSHEVVLSDHCLTAHPLVEEILVEGRFDDATEIAITVGARTGERMVVVHPTATNVRVPADVAVIGADELARGASIHVHERIHDRLFRISAGSFFQCRPDGAEALVDLVGAALSPGPGVVLDSYSGVGLFGAFVDPARSLICVESNPSSVADARVNLAGRTTDQDRNSQDRNSIVLSTVEQWRSQPVQSVIADPARRGLGAKGVAALMACQPEEVVLVSCDAASLGRDARLLCDQHFDLEQVTVVDIFGHTAHVEAVSRFRRREPIRRLRT